MVRGMICIARQNLEEKEREKERKIERQRQRQRMSVLGRESEFNLVVQWRWKFLEEIARDGGGGGGGEWANSGQTEDEAQQHGEEKEGEQRTQTDREDLQWLATSWFFSFGGLQWIPHLCCQDAGCEQLTCFLEDVRNSYWSFARSCCCDLERERVQEEQEEEVACKWGAARAEETNLVE